MKTNSDTEITCQTTQSNEDASGMTTVECFADDQEESTFLNGSLLKKAKLT